MAKITEIYDRLAAAVKDRSVDFYADRLVSIVIFGSVGRRSMRPDSDIDFLLVADPLPRGRMRRVDEFDAVESGMRDLLDSVRREGVYAALSPVFKTPSEVRSGSPLFWDMLDDSRILFDRDDFFRREQEQLKERLMRLGAKRIWKGNAWLWDFKPDYKYGEEFEL